MTVRVYNNYTGGEWKDLQERQSRKEFGVTARVYNNYIGEEWKDLQERQSRRRAGSFY